MGVFFAYKQPKTPEFFRHIVFETKKYERKENETMAYKPTIRRFEIREVVCMALVALLGLAMVMFFCTGNLHADAGETMFGVVFSIITKIVMIIGVLIGVVGIAKFAISHAEGQGADQHKAILMMATGVILVVLPLILDGFKAELLSIITDASTPTT